MSENPNSPNPQTPAQTPPSGAPPPPPKQNGNGKLQSPLFLVPATLAVAVLFFFGLRYLVTTLTGESSDDAFIAGHIVSIAPRISGQVSAVYVRDNEFVHSNQLLVELDPSDFTATLDQKKAAQESENSNFKAAVAGYKLMEVKVKTAEADARESKADAAAAAATEAKAQNDFKRARELVKENTISSSEFDQFKAAEAEAEADLNSARAKASADESKVNEARAQLDAARAEANAIFAEVGESKTEVDSAQLNVSYTKIFAPCDGLVTRKQVEAGDYLQAGQTMLSLVPRDVWVVANFKESQLDDMKPGQKALVSIDALGGQTFRAHVDSIQAGSGAVFSLLPPENAVGNYVKVVQRVPVKIVFDQALPADKTIGPGLSVDPYVRTSSFQLPDWVMAIAALVLAAGLAIVFKTVMGK